MPALGTPRAYTASGRQFDSVVKYLMGADAAGHDLSLRLEGLPRRYLLNMVNRHPDVEKETRPGGRGANLVAWIERGVCPQGEDVLAPDLSRIGLRWTPILHPEDPLAPRRSSSSP